MGVEAPIHQTVASLWARQTRYTLVGVEFFGYPSPGNMAPR